MDSIDLARFAECHQPKVQRKREVIRINFTAQGVSLLIGRAQYQQIDIESSGFVPINRTEEIPFGAVLDRSKALSESEEGLDDSFANHLARLCINPLNVTACAPIEAAACSAASVTEP
jgi:hypothetical protein